jgi:hypothetical protein
MSECLTHLIRQNNAQVATGSPYAASLHRLGYGLRSLPRYSAYRGGNDFPCMTADFIIGLSLGGSDQVIIGPHTIQVTRSMNNFGQLPSPATLALRGTGTSINLGTQGTYDYLFAHYGGPGGGTAEVWYVGDLSGVINIPSIGFGHGLSGWALFTAPNGSVPDGGATVMLLGAALGALGMVRRFLMG